MRILQNIISQKSKKVYIISNIFASFLQKNQIFSIIRGKNPKAIEK